MLFSMSIGWKVVVHYWELHKDDEFITDWSLVENLSDKRNNWWRQLDMIWLPVLVQDFRSMFALWVVIFIHRCRKLKLEMNFSYLHLFNTFICNNRGRMFALSTSADYLWTIGWLTNNYMYVIQQTQICVSDCWFDPRIDIRIWFSCKWFQSKKERFEMWIISS